MFNIFLTVKVLVGAYSMEKALVEAFFRHCKIN